MKILIATGNKGKFIEISNLLKEVGIEAVSPDNYNLQEPEENGNSFQENSLIKAKYYGLNSNMIALADDSGLCVDLLDGEPGIHSARLALDEKTGKKDFNLAFSRIEQKLIKKGFDPKKDEIKAHFICNLTIFNPQNNEYYSFEGRVDGNLTFPPKGEKGFGYDPVFIAEVFGNKTFGEVEYEEKERVSHRFEAFKQLKDFLQSENFKKFIAHNDFGKHQYLS